jgi:hypothetical protein
MADAASADGAHNGEEEYWGEIKDQSDGFAIKHLDHFLCNYPSFTFRHVQTPCLRSFLKRATTPSRPPFSMECSGNSGQ